MPPELANLKGRTFLLGVGAQKAGTTWIHDYLNTHPGVFMSPVKEMSFFGYRTDSDKWPITGFRRKLRERTALAEQAGQEPIPRFVALRERIRMNGDMKAYRRFFRKRVTSEQVFGEISPIYSRLPIEELEFIKNQFRHTKVLFVMRNPADRLWSQMRFSENFETIEDLEKKLPKVLSKPVYYERCDYIRTIENLRSVFDADNIHFEFYENLFTDAAVQRLCDFLKVRYHPADFSKTLNVSIKMPLSPLLRPGIVEQLLDQYAYVIGAFGSQVPKSWLRDMD